MVKSEFLSVTLNQFSSSMLHQTKFKQKLLVLRLLSCWMDFNKICIDTTWNHGRVLITKSDLSWFNYPLSAIDLFHHAHIGINL